MVNRLIDPTEGRITIDGTGIPARPAAELRRSIGYVIQHAGILLHRTIVDNIATVPRLLGTDRRTAKARAHELMDLVGREFAVVDGPALPVPASAPGSSSVSGGGFDQRPHDRRILAGAVKRLLDRKYFRVFGGTFDKSHHRRIGIVGMM